MSDNKTRVIKMCGKMLRLGDYVKVRYTTGKRFKGSEIKGKIVELWSPEYDDHLQARVENGWCFHDGDKIIEHVPAFQTDRNPCDLCGGRGEIEEGTGYASEEGGELSRMMQCPNCRGE